MTHDAPRPLGAVATNALVRLEPRSASSAVNTILGVPDGPPPPASSALAEEMERALAPCADVGVEAPPPALVGEAASRLSRLDDAMAGPFADEADWAGFLRPLMDSARYVPKGTGALALAGQLAFALKATPRWLFTDDFYRLGLLRFEKWPGVPGVEKLVNEVLAPLQKERRALRALLKAAARAARAASPPVDPRAEAEARAAARARVEARDAARKEGQAAAQAVTQRPLVMPAPVSPDALAAMRELARVRLARTQGISLRRQASAPT